MNPERDDDLVRRYGEASAELDERPAASTRASILAAAAREVGARPADAAKYRRRWPLAAAAAVMLSTLAVMLAIRTDEQMPQFSAPAEPARSSVQNVAPATPAVDQAAPENQPPTAPSERPAVRARREGGRVADAPNETKRSMPPPATAPAEPSAPPAPKASAPSKPRTDESEARAMDQSSDARRDTAQGAARAPSVAAQRQQNEVEEPAAAWLERIIKLRRAGRNEEADDEIKRFRERHPQVQLPPEALPATGTR